MTDRLELPRPDDAHLHLRDGAALSFTVPATADVFGRAVVMPNLVPAVSTVADALAYRARILEALPSGASFEPLMTLYLTEATTADEVARAVDAPEVVAAKYYPRGATTHSGAGARDLAALEPVLEAMAERDLPLLVHGEVTAPDVDIFDRERVFLERSLAPLVERLPGLRVVVEHATTREAVQFVQEAREGVAATLTPQHLLMHRGHLFEGGLQPHNYCLPILKREHHREALRAAALSGSPRFFLGTDSAPHARSQKEAACGCAGCYSAPAALPLYAALFDGAGALGLLADFAAGFAADFYRLPRSTETIALERSPWTVPERLEFSDGDEIVPYWAGRELAWRVA